MRVLLPSERRRTSRRRTLALERVLATHNALDRSTALARDPVRFARRYESRDDRELAALVSALLAFGNVTTIGNKLHELLVERLRDRPAAFIDQRSRGKMRSSLEGFVHRTFVGEDIAALLFAARELQRERGSVFAPLEDAFAREQTLLGALVAWVALLRSRAFGPSLTRSQQHLLPDPAGNSACKRLVLLCRWIARPDDGVDLGLVSLPTRALVVPLDVHVHRIARSLGFTKRPSASWKAALEVTAALAELDAEDPVKFDFALCHTEIAQRLNRQG
ncbi:MAG: TIGR02757 family protein [Myxococcales bacterium]|nr:TIGR02757 family protein [Myxococcales bacterium]